MTKTRCRGAPPNVTAIACKKVFCISVLCGRKAQNSVCERSGIQNTFLEANAVKFERALAAWSGSLEANMKDGRVSTQNIFLEANAALSSATRNKRDWDAFIVDKQGKKIC